MFFSFISCLILAFVYIWIYEDINLNDFCGFILILRAESFLVLFAFFQCLTIIGFIGVIKQYINELKLIEL